MDEVPVETVHTPASGKLLAWIQEKAKPSQRVTKTTYDTVAYFKQCYPDIVNQYQYDLSPA